MASAAHRRALGPTSGALASPSIRLHAFVDARGSKPGIVARLLTAPNTCRWPCPTPTCQARRQCHSVQRRGLRPSLTVATAVPPTVQSAQVQGVTLEAVLSALRQVHGIDRLDPDAEVRRPLGPVQCPATARNQPLA